MVQQNVTDDVIANVKASRADVLARLKQDPIVRNIARYLGESIDTRFIPFDAICDPTTLQPHAGFIRTCAEEFFNKGGDNPGHRRDIAVAIVQLIDEHLRN